MPLALITSESPFKPHTCSFRVNAIAENALRQCRDPSLAGGGEPETLKPWLL
jgi:hypothetical protein